MIRPHSRISVFKFEGRNHLLYIDLNTSRHRHQAAVGLQLLEHYLEDDCGFGSLLLFRRIPYRCRIPPIIVVCLYQIQLTRFCYITSTLLAGNLLRINVKYGQNR